MGKDMNNYNDVAKKFENILDKLEYKYQIIDFLNDDDINYSIQLNAYGKLSKLHTINVLMYMQTRDFSLHIMVGNIYRFAQSEDLSPSYKTVNKVNEMSDYGSFVVSEKLKQIIYSDSIYCGVDFKELSENKVKFIIDRFINNLILFLNILHSENKYD